MADQEVSPAEAGVEALWRRVVAEWEDDRPHAAFLEYCRQKDLLAEAAVRYRGMVGDRERGPSADKRLQAVLMVALSKLETSRTPPGRSSGDGLRLVLIVLFVAGTVALLVVAAPLLR